MKSKDRLLKVLAAAAALIIVLFFTAEMYNLVGRTYSTVTVTEQTVLETIDAKMYIIRDETLLTSPASGVTVPLAENGERVSRGSTVAAVFPSEASAENYIQASSLEAKLETYQKIDSQLRLADVDLAKLTEETDSEFIKLLDAAYNNDFSSLSDSKLLFSEKLSRKQISLDKNVDCSAKIASLQNEISALRSSSNPTQIITAESAGYYVSKIDGYENVLTCSDLDSLTQEQLENAFNAEKQEPSFGSIGKIIDGYNWYIATVIDSAKAKEITSNMSARIVFDDFDSEPVKTNVYLNKTVDSDKSLLIFRCNLMNDHLAQLRMVDGKIVINEYTGLKVDRDAIRVDENGKSGVFIRRGNIVNFRSLNIIYSEDSFVIASKPSESSDIELDYPHLKLYDEVIISGKELKDGMVIG